MTGHRDDQSSILDFIMAYEDGAIEDQDHLVKGFQQLIDSGIAWQLQGHYGRTAEMLIKAGHCRRHHNA